MFGRKVATTYSKVKRSPWPTAVCGKALFAIAELAPTISYASTRTCHLNLARSTCNISQPCSNQSLSLSLWCAVISVDSPELRIGLRVVDINLRKGGKINSLLIRKQPKLGRFGQTFSCNGPKWQAFWILAAVSPPITATQDQKHPGCSGQASRKTQRERRQFAHRQRHSV